MCCGLPRAAAPARTFPILLEIPHLGAKLGFIDIGVSNGSADVHAAVSLRLQPPGGPAGGKVSIPQLATAIVSNPGNVVASPAVTGSARMDLPIVVEGGVLGAIVGTPQLAVR